MCICRVHTVTQYWSEYRTQHFNLSDMALPPFFIRPLEIVLHQSCVQTPVLHLFPSAGVDGVSCIVQTDFLLQSSYWMANPVEQEKKSHNFSFCWKNWSMKKPVWWWLKEWISLDNLLLLLILSNSCHLLYHKISSPQWFTTDVIALWLFYNQFTSVEPTQKHIDSSFSNLIKQIRKYHKNAPLWPLFKRQP